MKESIFRQESIKKITSPEELHDYIRISNPAIWTILGGIMVLVAAMLIWAAGAKLDTKCEMNGIVKDVAVVCYCRSVGAVEAGQNAKIGDTAGRVVSVSERPVSFNEIAAEYGAGSYEMYCLDPGDWNYVVTVETDTPAAASGEVVTVSIITDSVSPMSFIGG